MRASEISAALSGRLLGDDRSIAEIKTLRDASSSDLSIVMWPADIRAAKKSSAGVLLLSLDHAADYADVFLASLVVVEDLRLAVCALKHWWPKQKTHSEQRIAESAVIHERSHIGNATIGAHSVIGPNVVISDGAVIGSNCIINAGVMIHANTQIKDNVQIGANSVIGSEGFVPQGDYAKCLPCFGQVCIEDNVRIGALVTIDRGFLGTTFIGRNSLIDNMVHIGHDTVIKENVIIAAQAGLAGFVSLENNVTVGGQSGIKPHVIVHEGARISGKSMVHCDIKSNQIWSGNPSVPHALYLRSYGQLKRTSKDKSR